MANAAGSLKNLQSEIQKGEKASYEATYKTTGSGGSSSPITFAQEPGGKYAFTEPGAGGSGGTDFVADGKNTYECSQGRSSNGTASRPPSRGALRPRLVPFFGFTGGYFYAIVEALQVEAAIAGFKVTNSTTTVNGISLKCVSLKGKVNGQAEDDEWCVTGDGILGLVRYTGSGAGDTRRSRSRSWIRALRPRSSIRPRARPSRPKRLQAQRCRRARRCRGHIRSSSLSRVPSRARSSPRRWLGGMQYHELAALA